MKTVLLFVLFVAFASAASAEDLTANPTSLAFGTVNTGQGKTVTFILKNTSGHKVRAEFSTVAPFTIAPSNPTLEQGQQINVSVTLPPTAAAGSYNKKLQIKGSRLGLIPRLQAEVSLSATVTAAPAGPDLQIQAIDNGNSVNQQVRTVGVRLVCKSVGLGNAAVKTQVFVSLDGGPEEKKMDISFVYTSSGQPNSYGQQIPTSVKTMKVRAVADPANAIAESNENNNQSILTLNF